MMPNIQSLEELAELNPELKRLATKTSLFDEEVDKLNELLKLVENEKEEKISTYVKGKRLEDLISYYFHISNVFYIINNGKTSSNEIDITAILTQSGNYLRKEDYIKSTPSRIIIECKSYKDKVETKYANLFANLVTTSEADLGIFVSNHGLTGNGELYWKDGTAAIKKYNLLNKDTKNERMIIDLTLQNIIDAIDSKITIHDLINLYIYKMKADINKDVSYPRHEKSGSINWKKEDTYLG